MADLDFNIFDYCKMIEGDDGLAILMIYLFDENDLFEKLNIEFQTFYNYMKKIQSGFFFWFFTVNFQLF